MNLYQQKHASTEKLINVTLKREEQKLPSY